MYDVLIIGGGPGGIYAAIMASLCKMKSCVVERMSVLGGQPVFFYPNKDIYDFPCIKKITGKHTMDLLVDQMYSMEEFKPDVFLSSKIIKIDNKQTYFDIKFKNNEAVQAKAIIIASGSSSLKPQKLLIDEKEVINKKISYFFENEEKYQDKKVIILGGGDSALDWAIHLIERKITKEVKIIHRNDILRARQDKIDKVKELGIEILLDKKIVEVNKNEISFLDNKNQNKESLNFDEIIVQYGFMPSKHKVAELFEGIQTDKLGFNVDHRFESSIKMVFAVGQATNYLSKPNVIIVSMSEATKAVYAINKELKART